MKGTTEGLLQLTLLLVILYVGWQLAQQTVIQVLTASQQAQVATQKAEEAERRVQAQQGELQACQQRRTLLERQLGMPPASKSE